MTNKFRLTLIFIFCISLFSFTQNTDLNNPHQITTLDSKLLNANNISDWFRNNGSFNRNPESGNGGFEWPKGSGKTARYASGLWLGCISGNDTLTAVAEYSIDYRSGYVDNNGYPQGENDPLYRIYEIDRGDTTSPDYINWPVNQGAYLTPEGKPFFLGTQTMFYSYTDAYPHGAVNTSLISLKAQILQTNWCYTNIGLQDVNFIEYKLINRSSSPWTKAYISFWTDDDLGEATDDRIGCDTNRDLGFTYNAVDIDPIYGPAPPSVGTLVLRSPLFFTGNYNDTAKYYDPPGSVNLRKKAGYKFTGMSIFNYYNSVMPWPSQPQRNAETYRVLSGLWRTGESWVNPITGDTTLKTLSGDPVTGTGWLNTGGTDRRFLMSCGPFYMNPNDTQSIIFAQVIARGSSNLNSITQLRSLSDHVKSIYDQNFQSVLTVKNISSELPNRFELKQNYPNPFNPTTKIKFDIMQDARGEKRDVKLIVYDASGKEVKTLVNEKLSPGSYEVEFNGNNLSSGVYFYKLETDNFTETKRMILLK